MTLYEVLKQFFDEDDWPYNEDKDENSLYTAFSPTGDRSWRCRAMADEERETALFFSHAPANAPYESRLAMSEFLTRVNYGLFVGNFEMDINDGEVRYKTSLNVQGGTFNPALARNLVYTNVLAMKRYLPGIEAVIAGTMTPVEALAMCETD